MKGRVISGLAQRPDVEQPQRREHYPEKALPYAGRRRDYGVGGQQQREHERERDEWQALVRHEDHGTDEYERETGAHLGDVRGGDDQKKYDQACAEHGEGPRFAMAKL